MNLRTRGPVTLAALLIAVTLAACGTAETPVPTPPAPPEITGGSVSAAQTCTDRLQSYAPDATNPFAMPGGSTMAAIKARGRLIAGVSADSYLLGARNPVSGEVEGFDIDQVKQIAKAIFGDENRYQLRVITAAQRLEVLQNHEVDVVVRNMTITCDRWKDASPSRRSTTSRARRSWSARAPTSPACRPSPATGSAPRSARRPWTT